MSNPLAELAKVGQSVWYDQMERKDISDAAEIFRPVYDRNDGNDGFISIEVSPTLANDTKGSIGEAKRLFERLKKPNVMEKIPATPAGLPAIEESIFNGININITLLFSNDVYGQVMEAYLRGLERRVDTQADKQIEAKMKETDDQELQSLLGKIAISNAKLAYQQFKKVFSSDR